MVATFWLTRSMRSVCALANVDQPAGDRRQVLHALLQVLERGAVEGLADPLGDVADVAGDAAGLRGELADVGQGGAGPRLAAGAGPTRSARRAGWGRSGSGSKETMLALHSPNRLAEAEITAGLGGSSTLAVDAELGLDPLVLAPGGWPRPGRPCTPRSVTGAPTPSPPTVRKRGGVGGLLLVDVGLAQPERAGDHQRERQRAPPARPRIRCSASSRPPRRGRIARAPLDELAHHRISRSPGSRRRVPTWRMRPRTAWRSGRRRRTRSACRG